MSKRGVSLRVPTGGVIIGGVFAAVAAYIGYRLYSDYWSQNSLQLAAIQTSNTATGVTQVASTPTSTTANNTGTALEAML
jgi:hypothetical protein